MSERAKALEILRRARDLLAQRLSQRVLETEEGLLDDANGASYLSDIETIYEQFGAKLTHLNQLINNLPQDDPASQPESEYSGADYVSPMAADAAVADDLMLSHPPAMSVPLILSPPALPAPRMDEELQLDLPSFARFVAQIRSDELREAARTLSALLDISEGRGLQCVRVFHHRWEEDESLLVKALQLRGEVLSSSYNSALMSLAECFGLVGIEAIGVLQALRTRFLEA